MINNITMFLLISVFVLMVITILLWYRLKRYKEEAKVHYAKVVSYSETIDEMFSEEDSLAIKLKHVYKLKEKMKNLKF
jgi:hypothetical protein